MPIFVIIFSDVCLIKEKVIHGFFKTEGVFMKVIVVGAGAAGLSAIYSLKKMSIDVSGFEAEPFAGGRARCYEKEGFTIDTGAQFMAKVCKTQIKLAGELGLKNEILSFPLKTAMWRDDKFYPLPTAGSPLKAIAELPDLIRFRGLPFKACLQMAKVAFHMLKRFINVNIEEMNPECLIDLGDMSVEEFTLKHGGREALEWITAPITASLTLGEANEVSIPHIIGLMGLYEGLLLMKKGIGSLPQALYESCADSISLSKPVRKIVIEDKKIKGVETEDGFVEADAVICATTATKALELLHGLPDTIRKPLETVKYSSTLHVSLALRRRLLPSGIYAIGLPKAANSFLPGLNDCSEKSPDFAPPGTGLSHCVTYGRQSHEFMKMDDETAVGKIIDEVKRFVPLDSEDIIFADVVRWKDAICLESPGQFPAMYCLKRNNIGDVKGLHLAGSYMYLVSCVEGALRSGEDAARSIVSSL